MSQKNRHGLIDDLKLRKLRIFFILLIRIANWIANWIRPCLTLLWMVDSNQEEDDATVAKEVFS